MSARAVRIAAGYVEIGARTTKLQGALGQLQTRLNRMARRFARIGMSMSLVGGALVGFFSPFIRDAAIATEVLNKFNQTFKGMNKEAENFAQTFAGKLNRSITEVREQMASFGAFYRGMEFGNQQMMEMTKTTTKLVADMASFENISDSEALQRMQSMLAGSSEVMDRFGINTREAALDQEFLRNGLDVTTRSASEQQKVMARLNIFIRRQNDKNASGDALRTMNTLMGTTRQFQGMLRNFREDVGRALEEPARKFMLAVIPLVKWLAEWAKKNRTLLKTITVLGAGFAGLSVIVLGLAVAMKTLSFALSALGMLKVIAVIGPLIPAITLLTAAVGTAAMVWREYSQNGMEAFEELGRVIAFVGEQWTTAFKAMTTAANAGDMSLAFEILTTTLRQIWTEFLAWMTDSWYKAVLDVYASIPGGEVGLKMLGIDYRKEMQSLNELADARRELNRLELLNLSIKAKKKKELAEQKKAEEQLDTFDIAGAAGAGGKGKSGRKLNQTQGTFSGFIANRLGFRGTQEGKEKTWKTEQTPAERKAQAEAIQKAIDNGQFKSNTDEIKDNTAALVRFWNNAAVV